MKILRHKSELEAVLCPGLGFVPTMGAFHEGHLQLMRRAKADCGFCAVSLFVNPTQFGPGEDYQSYPRDEERDLALAVEAGADVLFAPSPIEMYQDSHVSVDVGELANRWEGASRPGHFIGVATVVSKLFNLFRPKRAYFGLKDFQQCAVIRKLVRGLDFPVELEFVETVREPDGLAMSSRNAYLGPEERSIAPLLYRTLQRVSQDVNRDPKRLEEWLERGRLALEDAGFSLDYLEMVDSENLETLHAPVHGSRLIVAAKLGKTRLIDNCAVGAESHT